MSIAQRKEIECKISDLAKKRDHCADALGKVALAWSYQAEIDKLIKELEMESKSETDHENNASILKPESYVFVRGLIDCFHRGEELQMNPHSPGWVAFMSDMIMCAESGKLDQKVIFTRDGEEEYLIRHYLINERPKTRVTLHKALISDSDELHNHPWPWASLILTGGYWEDTPDGKFWRAPGNFRVRKAQDLHRLIIDKQRGTVWTLFIMGEKEQDWGFLQPDGTIEQWQKYLHRKTGIWYDE